MNFFKLLVIGIVLHVTVYAYSFQPQKMDAEMFEYEMRGQKYMFNRRIVELHMHKKFWILGVLAFNAFELFVLKDYKIFAFLTIITLDFFAYKEMKKFQEQAGPWLKALKEKEALLKASQTSNNDARAGAPSEPLINKGSAHS